MAEQKVRLVTPWGAIITRGIRIGAFSALFIATIAVATGDDSWITAPDGFCITSHRLHLCSCTLNAKKEAGEHVLARIAGCLPAGTKETRLIKNIFCLMDFDLKLEIARLEKECAELKQQLEY